MLWSACNVPGTAPSALLALLLNSHKNPMRGLPW